jgi:8-oxo-dGTP diphosphatase
MEKIFNVGIKGLIVKNNKVLLLKKINPFKEGGFFWDVPGGRIEENEDVIETLSRELKEELPKIGKFNIGNIIHATRLHDNIKENTDLFMVYYYVEAEDFDIKLSNEHLSYIWHDIDDLGNDELQIDSMCLSAIEKLKKYITYK